MHKLLEYVCDELETLERKAEKGNKLSMQELQYADTLAHLKKNMLTADAMMEADDGGSYDSYSYARGRNARRDSMGRYSRDTYHGNGYSRANGRDDVLSQLRDMEHDADEETKHMIKKWIRQIEEQ